MFLAALIFASVVQSRSTQLTSAAEELLKIEKRLAGGTDLEPDLYEDVLTLLDEAIDDDPTNLNAHALESGVLLLKSDNGDGTYDVCYLLDARDEANRVVAERIHASAADLTTARRVLKDIARIPPSAVPDPPSSCNGDDQRKGTRARFRAR